jgi:hypothetical protein
LATRHVVVVDLGRRRHRRIGEAQRRGVELEAVEDIEGIGRFVELDDVLLAGAKLADHDRRQRVGSLQAHQVAGEQGHLEDVDARAMRDQRPPVGAIRRGERRGVDAKIDQPLLRCFLVAAGDDAEAAAGAFLDGREPARIHFLIDQHVVALRRAEVMAKDVQRAVILVALHIEKECRVRAPHDATAGLLQDVGQVFSGFPVAHPDGEVLRAAQVGAPGHEAMVGRMTGLAEIEIL